MKKRSIAIFMVFILASALLSGCKKENQTQKLGNVNIDFGAYQEAEDIPKWEGSELKLTVWQDANAPNAYQRFASSPSDAVIPEFTRITGVVLDTDESFDNAGNSYDAKITQIVASGDFPDMAVSLPEISELVKTDRLWDLTEYIEKYCPNIMKMMGPKTTVFKNVWEDQKEKYGGLYALAIGNKPGLVKKMAEKDGVYNLSEEQIKSICGPGTCPYGYVYVRDDILKKLYPNARTAKELQELYQKNGGFTREELFDVPVHSPQDFIDMLYRIQKMDLKDEEGPVYTTYTHEGSDNWTALVTGGGAIFGHSAQYFNYIDWNTGKAEYTFKQEWFKNMLRQYNQLIRDGIVPSENLMDTAQTHKEKLSNARYAVSISPYMPDTTGLNGKYQYRRVYFSYDRKYDQFMNTGVNADGLRKISFFKDSMSESELIQALRAFDFLVSMPGQKLTYWGAKSAGLYTETPEGVLQYKDEKLKDQMLNSGLNGTDLIEKYGLLYGAWPGRTIVEASAYRPEAFYAKDMSWETAFNPAYLENESIDLPQMANGEIYSAIYTSLIPEVKSFWMARQAFEDALLQIFAATSDAEFEQRYQDMVSLAERNGLTDETLAKFQSEFDKANKNFKAEQDEFKNLMKTKYGERKGL